MQFIRSLAVTLFLINSLIVLIEGSIDQDAFQFGPYYNDFDEDSGERKVGNDGDWRVYGDARVHSSFIRLTPDRQSKQGALWSRGPSASTSLNAILEFRISGQGKKLFGDGLGLWFVNQPYYSSGHLQGNNEYFNGSLTLKLIQLCKI